MSAGPADLVEAEMQPLSDGGDHLCGRLGPKLALEAGVVVGRQVAQGGDLLINLTVAEYLIRRPARREQGPRIAAGDDDGEPGDDGA